MGFTPADVGKMSLWEFNAVVRGYNRANGAAEPVVSPTFEEHDELVRKYG